LGTRISSLADRVISAANKRGDYRNGLDAVMRGLVDRTPAQWSSAFEAGLACFAVVSDFHWKRPKDIAHYREGFEKAGIPSGKLTLLESSPRLAVNS
jgi:hypothetical protein